MEKKKALVISAIMVAILLAITTFTYKLLTREAEEIEEPNIQISRNNRKTFIEEGSIKYDGPFNIRTETELAGETPESTRDYEIADFTVTYTTYEAWVDYSIADSENSERIEGTEKEVTRNIRMRKFNGEWIAIDPLFEDGGTY